MAARYPDQVWDSSDEDDDDNMDDLLRHRRRVLESTPLLTGRFRARFPVESGLIHSPLRSLSACAHRPRKVASGVYSAAYSPQSIAWGLPFCPNRPSNH
jgi:hypothetical protein